MFVVDLANRLRRSRHADQPRCDVLRRDYRRWRPCAPHQAIAPRKCSRYNRRLRRREFSFPEKSRDRTVNQSKVWSEAFRADACAEFEASAPGEDLNGLFFCKPAIICRTVRYLMRGPRTFKLCSSDPHCKMSIST